MENTRATFEGMERLRPDVRPFVMTRASYAGGQRYAVTWTGDNSSTWDHLRLCVEQLINLGLSGFAYSGCDVGGFTGGASPELLTRWFEIAAFTPVFRDHSANDAPRAEPWVDGPAQLAIRRRFIEERYRLLPYLYALADENARTGDPLMRPTFYDYPRCAEARLRSSRWRSRVGRDLLVAASAASRNRPSRTTSACQRAAGTIIGPGCRSATHKLTRDAEARPLPVFVRAGTILPRQPLVQSTSETPKGPLQLDVYPGEDCRGELYFDDGVSIERAKPSAGDRLHGHRARASRCGSARARARRPWWKQIAVTVHGAPAEAHGSSPTSRRAATVQIR